MVATGANGTLALYDDRVRLTKRGARATFGVGYGAGTKDIALSQISAIQWRDAGTLWLGFIAFSFLGGADPSGGLFDATKSENAVTFERSHQRSFESIRAEVQARIGRRGEAATLPKPTGAQALRELAELRDAGLVTAEEFEAKKAEILQRM